MTLFVFLPVSSSQGFTSRRMLDFATTAGSKINKQAQDYNLF